MQWIISSIRLLIIESFSTPRILTTHTHGTGCILSSAIATNLAKGMNLSMSIEKAKKFAIQ